MYFQLEVDYYSNEANKNNYKNVELTASTKTTFDSYRLHWALHLQRPLVMLVAWTSKYLVVWAWCCLKVYL